MLLRVSDLNAIRSAYSHAWLLFARNRHVAVREYTGLAGSDGAVLHAVGHGQYTRLVAAESLWLSVLACRGNCWSSMCRRMSWVGVCIALTRPSGGVVVQPSISSSSAVPSRRYQTATWSCSSMDSGTASEMRAGSSTRLR